MFEAFYIVDIFEGRLRHYRLETFLLHSDFLHTIFGEGIGVTDRLVEKFTNDNPPAGFVPGCESYILKIYYEQGMFGFVSFAILGLSSIKNSFFLLNTTAKITLSSVIVGLSTNLLFTTSFAGFTISFLLWPILLYPFFARKLVFPQNGNEDVRTSH